MSTKDWKLYRKKANSISYWNEKNKEGISVVQFMNNKKGEWSFTSRGKTKKTFKTKSKAIKFAKAYMRKH